MEGSNPARGSVLPTGMGLDALRLVALSLIALMMSAGFAHLFALPNKIGLSRDAYLTVQQIYRGWALLGVVFFAALALTAWLAMLVRQRASFYPTLVAALSIGASLVVFFLFTYPVNQQTQNWTLLPENWEALRRQWEYSHAAGAVLDFVALISLALSLVAERR
jgi:hypothetical protein